MASIALTTSFSPLLHSQDGRHSFSSPPNLLSASHPLPGNQQKVTQHVFSVLYACFKQCACVYRAV